LNKAALYVNAQKDPDFSFLERILGALEKNGVSCVVHEPPEGLPAGCVKATAENLPGCDIAIVAGGDGTMLNAISDFGAYGMPFLGINLGKVGFLTDVKSTETAKRLDMLLAGEYEVESRMMIRATQGGQILGDVLNEVALKHEFGSGVGEFKCFSNGRLIGHYSADGVLIVTPTGSTAYSMSAGGPIVNPRCEVMILQPLAPHSLNNRAIVVPADEAIDIRFDNTTTYLYLDGEDCRPQGGEISAVLSPKAVRFVKFSDYDFYGLLFEKVKQTNYLRGGLS